MRCKRKKNKHGLNGREGGGGPNGFVCQRRLGRCVYLITLYWINKISVKFSSGGSSDPLPLSFPSLIYTRYSCFSFLTTQWQYITHCYCYVHQSVKLINIYLICLSMILKLILPKCTSNVCSRQLIGWRSLKTVKSTQQKTCYFDGILNQYFFWGIFNLISEFHLLQ